MTLAKTEEFQVAVINPRLIKNYLRSHGVRSKTDKIDSAGILSYLEAYPFRRWTPPSPEVLGLKAIGRRIYQLTDEICRENNRLETIEAEGGAVSAVAKDIKKSIKDLEKRILRLEDDGMELVKRREDLRLKFVLLVSIKGIARRTALRLLGELLCIPEGLKGPQWVAYAGLDPRVRQSGTSIDSHRYISKAGNRYIRAALYMPALVSINTEEVVTAKYKYLVEVRAKAKMIAIIAVMRKLLLSIYGMLKTSSPFDPILFSKSPSIQ